MADANSKFDLLGKSTSNLSPPHSPLNQILDLARTLPIDELPRLIGGLAEIQAIAMARLVVPVVPVQDSGLSIEEAAKVLGMSASYLYHRRDKFKFIRHEGRRLVCSSRGIEEYVRRRSRER